MAYIDTLYLNLVTWSDGMRRNNIHHYFQQTASIFLFFLKPSFKSRRLFRVFVVNKCCYSSQSLFYFDSLIFADDLSQS